MQENLPQKMWETNARMASRKETCDFLEKLLAVRDYVNTQA
jgi:hypothetical protein